MTTTEKAFIEEFKQLCKKHGCTFQRWDPSSKSGTSPDIHIRVRDGATGFTAEELVQATGLPYIR